MSDKAHWDQVYVGRADDALSWYQRHAVRSLAYIEASGAGRDAAIIDVGGGASNLVADLLHKGYAHLWVLDISPAALATARRRLGDEAARVHWVEADVTRAQLPPAYFDVWHDRAVFHFLTEPAARAAYVAQVHAVVKPGGHVIIATFAEDGPERCSGLPVVRYDARTLAAQFGEGFELLGSEREEHRTPAGTLQRFRYCHLRRAPGTGRPKALIGS